MNEIKSLIARLIQNPDLAKSLPKALTDPQALGRLAGLGGNNLKALSGVGKAFSDIVGGFTKPARSHAGRPATPRLSTPRPSGSVPSSGTKNTAIAGTVALTAVAGAVAVVGTVATVAVSKRRKVT